jgi:hypothetical protein
LLRDACVVKKSVAGATIYADERHHDEVLHCLRFIVDPSILAILAPR